MVQYQILTQRNELSHSVNEAPSTQQVHTEKPEDVPAVNETEAAEETKKDSAPVTDTTSEADEAPATHCEAVSVSLRFRAYALGTFVADVIGTDTYHIVMTYT